MKKIVTGEQMKKLDQYTINSMKVPSSVLMERAGLAVSEAVTCKRFSADRILVVCGCGNNGGDGVCAARILHLKGYKVSVFVAGDPKKFSEGMREQVEIARNYRINFVKNPDYAEYTVIVDAVFGVGLSRPVTGRMRVILGQINKSHVPVVAVDIPSGLNSDTGTVMGIAVQADVTVTMAYAKPGLFLRDGQTHSGHVMVADIGIYDTRLKNQDEDNFCFFRTDKEDLGSLFIRQENGNKGTFGKVLLIAGSKNMAGAALLSGEACMRAGAGMLKFYTTNEIRESILSNLPEAMLSVFDTKEPLSEQLEKDMEWADVIGIGPGISTEPYAGQILEYVLKNKGNKPCVIDADALNLLSLHMSLLKSAAPPCIVTPHIGEFSRLTGMSVSELCSDIPKAVREFVQEYGVVCVCKDARTLTILPNGCAYINTSGNSALATAGSGDVLTGIILGILAGSDNHADIRVIPLAVYLHGILGEAASFRRSKAGVIASDLIEELTIQNKKLENQ